MNMDRRVKEQRRLDRRFSISSDDGEGDRRVSLNERRHEDRRIAESEVSARNVARWKVRAEKAEASLASRTQASAVTEAAADVLAERARQTEVEGWTLGHDDEHNDGSLAVAGACYALHLAGECEIINDIKDVRPPGSLAPAPRPRLRPQLWPVGWSWKWWKPKNRRRDLVRAGALILAEIERLDRAAALINRDPATEGK